MVSQVNAALESSRLVLGEPAIDREAIAGRSPLAIKSDLIIQEASDFANRRVNQDDIHIASTGWCKQPYPGDRSAA